MKIDYKKILDDGPIETSAPCRVDLGGTLDLATFYNPMRHQQPATFNMAIDMRTKVSLQPGNNKQVTVSSRGFECTQYHLDQAPFEHPLGLMFAIAAYFGAEGVHIVIDSTSPPRSALGGSSAAAVALVLLFPRNDDISDKIATTYPIESGGNQNLAMSSVMLRRVGGAVYTDDKKRTAGDALLPGDTLNVEEGSLLLEVENRSSIFAQKIQN